MTAIELNDLLAKTGLDPARVMVMRHRPTEPALRRALPWLAQDRHEVYNAYQSQHGERVETSLSRATHLASFIGNEARCALFVGVYAVESFRRISSDQFWTIPENHALKALGTRGPSDGRDSLWFDLRLTDALEAYKGRLVVEWSGIERAWWRWAARNVLPVQAIHGESLLVPPVPDWKELVLSLQELQTLPTSWRQALSHWRGIYYIHDRACGKGYVGSAYGADNLLGRWSGYAATGHGGNRWLRDRDPAEFVFSILQRTSPDTEAEEVIALESSWKERLHTRHPVGLNDN
ncbi:GIY-YIG nuclease family protein [Aerolutibacter ruishenii]|uniref:GIY-YIG domain-containing protein n=1 Tax=Aerolutibacter ruishenii TaxID=686800 RepID=A0A562LI76_9GAMM|nr:GIY-YIG nuclease family protein [Lysobacter ruishenii]TWI07291.1 hypothetical protein IP93_02643 [Lysobacter ruishenii]